MGRVLVTGGAGFIGSHLVSALVARGDEVVVLDDLSTGKRENLAGVAGPFEFVEGSLLCEASLARALDGVDAVLHEAALPSVPKSVAFPVETHQANVVGTLMLLDACQRAGVKRVVYAASSSAYGDHVGARKAEHLTPRPLSPYAAQKVTGEYYCRVFHHLHGLETIGLRYFNVFGPRQDPKSQYAAVIPAFASKMLRGEQPVVHGDGLQSRDFTFVGNVVAANLAALAAPASASGGVYNAACGDSTDLLSIIEALNTLLGTQIVAKHTASRAGDVRHSCADPSAAEAALGWKAQVTVAEGLEETIEWYRANLSPE